MRRSLLNVIALLGITGILIWSITTLQQPKSTLTLDEVSDEQPDTSIPVQPVHPDTCEIPIEIKQRTLLTCKAEPYIVSAGRMLGAGLAKQVELMRWTGSASILPPSSFIVSKNVNLYGLARFAPENLGMFHFT